MHANLSGCDAQGADLLGDRREWRELHSVRTCRTDFDGASLKIFLTGSGQVVDETQTLL